MTRFERPDDTRADALNSYLALSVAKGYEVETRTKTQAIIVRRSPGAYLLKRLRLGAGQQRRVVSVDEHGVVTTAAAEPLRW